MHHFDTPSKQSKACVLPLLKAIRSMVDSFIIRKYNSNLFITKLLNYVV